MTCDRSHALVWKPKQLMHMLLTRFICMFAVRTSRFRPGHSCGSESDRVLVPAAWPSTSTFHGVIPPFLLHMTVQFRFILKPPSPVFHTEFAMVVTPSEPKIFCDANLATPRFLL